MPLNESSPKSTVTAARLLNTGETLELLERLRLALSGLVTRMDQAEREFATRAGRVRTQSEHALETERARWTARLESGQAAAKTRRQKAEAAFNDRQLRILKAFESARKRKLAEIEKEESERTQEIQREFLEADRQRDADTQANKSTFDTFATLLVQEQGALQQTEVRARATLGGYRGLKRLLATPPPSAPPDLTPHEVQLLEQLRQRLAQAERELARYRRLVLPVLFRFLPVWLCVVLVLAAAIVLVPPLRKLDFAAVSAGAWATVGAALAVLFWLYFLGQRLARPAAQAAAIALETARQLNEACLRKSDASFAAEAARIQLTHATTTQALKDQWRQVQSEARALRSEWTRRLEDQARRLNALNEERKGPRLARTEREGTEASDRLQQDSARSLGQIEAAAAESLAKLMASRDAARQTISTEWQGRVVPAFTELRTSATLAQKTFPPWQPELWQGFTLPEGFTPAAKFADLAVDLEKLCGVLLTGQGVTLPGSAALELPLLLTVPQQASLLFETKSSGHEQVIGALNNIILRLLTSAPPGRFAFTIFDPVGLGQNFAGIMHLADFEERIINSRIWTQQAHFEQRLADLNEHIEKVTQMYLRNEYASLAEYNAQAGRLAEKYHFLVIADFPVNFSDVAVKRLQSIAASGPRCGVHLLVHWDQRKPAPLEFVPEELRKNAICIVPKGDGFALANANWDGVKLSLDAPPDASLATELLQRIGKDSTDSYRVEMPFVEAAPEENEFWSLDTTEGLRVPIGRTGATKLQFLAFGEGTRQHGLIAGKTGSGKSTLFHVIITNLALWCSPDAVEFYLVDFKKGVEFKCYATHRLPHARVIAIESDREFGLSVLQRVDEELKRRGDLFRKLGVQDLPGYMRAGGGEVMPRVLLLIDEFQELFVEDDRISQAAALLLDRIVRQGRAFGIHVLLGSQTLGGAYTLARATIGQMVVRVALQCNEADAYLIMNEDNPAPRLLSRPGEAIYNDEGGLLQGNSPFQVVWLPDQERDRWLRKVHEREEREPIVFEGNAPANVADNAVLRVLLEAPPKKPAAAPRVFLGAPNSIKGPTEAVFRRASGSHLLIVGQRDEAALAMLGVAMVSLAAQLPKTVARFLIFDCSAPDSTEAKFLEQAVRAIPHETRVVRPAELDEVLTALAAEQQQRAEDPAATGTETFLLVHRLQQNKKLRFDEEMSFSLDADAGANPGLQFNKLVCEGAGLGFHVIAMCDTYNNVMRMVSRKALSEFEMRVVFQMSANDSASLIDSPLANNLGLHRAILFNGHEGWLETFRPYALPDAAWLEEAGQCLRR